MKNILRWVSYFHFKMRKLRQNLTTANEEIWAYNPCQTVPESFLLLKITLDWKSTKSCKQQKKELKNGRQVWGCFTDCNMEEMKGHLNNNKKSSISYKMVSSTPDDWPHGESVWTSHFRTVVLWGEDKNLSKGSFLPLVKDLPPGVNALHL